MKYGLDPLQTLPKRHLLAPLAQFAKPYYSEKQGISGTPYFYESRQKRRAFYHFLAVMA